MKKALNIITILFVLSCFVFLLSGCVDVSTNLDESVESEIIDAFVTLQSQDNSPLDKERVSLRCYGAFNDAYVVFVDVSGWMYTAAIEIEEVGGLKFMYNNSQKLTVYSVGRFYSLTEAYNNNILSRQELKAVKRNFKK